MGECQRGQLERAVNPPAYACVGSNPTSPTRRASHSKMGGSFQICLIEYSYKMAYPLFRKPAEAVRASAGFAFWGQQLSFQLCLLMATADNL